MSFQSFRLGEMAMQQPLPPHLLQLQAGSSSQQFPGTADNTNSSAKIGQRAPYGSGDSDDGYTLVFPNITAFYEWKEKEEDAQIVEFVKVCIPYTYQSSICLTLGKRVTHMGVKPYLLVSKNIPSSSVLVIHVVAERNT
jgi:hypothetical protein